jgi:antitoxin component YwqK of YwqJK toxin-antitoxin module
MKKFTLVLLLIVSTAGLAFAADTDSLNIVDASGKRQGPWTLYGRDKKDPAYAPDAKWQEGRYKDSQKVGVWTEYYPTGSKKSELTFVNNRPNGHAVMYNENGKKSEEGTWVGTRWVGDYKLYYDDGTPRQSFNYSQLGQREGTQTYIHPNGKVAITVDMKGGKEQGWKKEYDENGNLIRETFFADGVIDPSKTKTYDTPAAKAPEKAPEELEHKQESKVVSDPNFKPNKGVFNGEGDWILYKNGQITMKGNFHQKKLVNGEERIYNNNGLLQQIKIYKDGKYVGDGPLPTDANK